MNDLGLFFRSLKDVAMATNFVGKIDLLPRATQFYCSINRSVSVTAARCWAQANKLPDLMNAGEPIN